MVTISCAELRDAADILTLQRLAYESEAIIYDDWSLPPLTQSLESLEQDFADCIVLKAVVSGRIVGSVRARLSDGVCDIGRMMVHPDHRSRGIGSSLLTSIQSRFPAASKFSLFTGSKSERNIGLYLRNGFKITRTESIKAGLSLTFLEKCNTNPQKSI